MADQAQTQAQESGGGEGVAAAAPAPAPADTAEIKPVEVPQPLNEAKLKETQPEVVPESKPEVVSEVKQEAVPENKPEEVPENKSQVVPDSKAEVVPESKPEAVPESKPEAVPESTPEAVPESTPEAVPESTPEAVPESNPDVVSESKSEVTQESKPAEPVKESSVEASATKDAVVSENNADGDWQQREQELLKKIEELENVKSERSADGLKLELKVREEEIDLLKARVRNLETELQAALSKPSGKNHEMIENIKQQHEELLSKARGMIFDKTKMVKNQELQIEALTTQVQSLKDINVITKDLLEIRNSEVKAMEDRLQAMEARFKAEKDRYGLVLQRAHTSTSLNEDLKKEYETQLAIFKELREKYEQRVQALVADNNRLKEAAKGAPST